jgi:serine/threonine protein kinase
MYPPKFQHLNHFNDYVFDCYLDEGGMSTVYKAFHQPTGEFRAIKKLKVEFMSDYQIRSKFQSEFVIMKNLDSENVIRVHDFISNGTDESYSMELIDGTTLKKKLKEQEEIDDEEKLRWMQGLLKALVHIHAKGITHRDVKPGNVFLTKERIIKLGDFGIAKDSQGIAGVLHDHTIYSMAPGTYPYISPEQYLKKTDLNYASDIYSAGMVMYELKKGEKAFNGSNNSHGENILYNQPIDIGNSTWDSIIKKAIQKNRDNRYKDAKEFLAEIELVLQDTKKRPLPVGTGTGAGTGSGASTGNGTGTTIAIGQNSTSNLEHYLILSILSLTAVLAAWLISELLIN